MLRVDPEERISLDDILDDPFVTKNDKRMKKTPSRGQMASTPDGKKNVCLNIQMSGDDLIPEDGESLEVRALKKKVLVQDKEIAVIVKSKQTLEEKMLEVMDDLERERA